jgi:DNA-binding NtrC family response regulator
MPEKILFVDDEVQVLEGFRRLLHNTFQIETAAGAAEALKKLRKSKNMPWSSAICACLIWMASTCFRK